jgi:putative SOS response-associated peptidase YedK
MCGRYVRKSDKQRIAEAFRVASDVTGLSMPPDDYNIAPSTFQPVIRESRDDGSREMVLMRWGLIPFFTKQLSDVKGVSTINARAESIQKSPTWREPFKKRRCLVPASAFYEWKRIDPKTKQPYAFTVSDVSLFAFAGLWDAWKDEQGHWLQSFSIVTTEANELMSQVHTRMPVILHQRDYDRWLSREVTEQPPVDLLRPYESEDMEMTAANPLVGNVKNNGPEMLNSA